jgi:hypothetical protein
MAAKKAPQPQMPDSTFMPELGEFWVEVVFDAEVLAAVLVVAEGVTMKKLVAVEGAPFEPVNVERTVEVDGSTGVSVVVVVDDVEVAGEVEDVVKVEFG